MKEMKDEREGIIKEIIEENFLHNQMETGIVFKEPKFFQKGQSSHQKGIRI